MKSIINYLTFFKSITAKIKSISEDLEQSVKYIEFLHSFENNTKCNIDKQKNLLVKSMRFQIKDLSSRVGALKKFIEDISN